MPYRLAIAQKGGYWDSNPGPSEPQSDALTNCAIPTIYEIRQAQSQTCSKGFEPPTHGLEGRCSIQLSYRLIRLSSLELTLLLILLLKALRKRVMGIEPTYPAWKAGVLPLNYTRTTHPQIHLTSSEEECPVPESNQRHEDFQSSALPTELPRHKIAGIGFEPTTFGL